MKNNIQNLRNTLFQRIETLIKIEPYWSKCTDCKNHGKCCINADISIRSDEFEIIKKYITELNDSDKYILKYNLEHNIFCPFRTKNKCLIHDVRPLNCIWTPFQVLQNINTNKITYFVSDYKCKHFIKIVKKSSKLHGKIVILKLLFKKRNYLFLNDIYIDYANDPNYPVENLSKLVNQVQSLIC